MDDVVKKSFELFFNKEKNQALSGMWFARTINKDVIDKIAMTSIRKLVFKIFNGTERTIETNGSIISISPDIKLSNKISLDILESNKGKIQNEIYTYLRNVLPTIGNNEDSDGYYQFDILSSFFNTWINFYDKLEVYYFVDPIKRFDGPHWKIFFNDLKLDGSSGVLNNETELTYDNFALINNDLNLYYNKMTMNFIDGDIETKLFKIDFTEQISELNSF